MLVLCPIEYEIVGVTKANRRQKRYGFKEIIELDIREVSAMDAPVAVEWSPHAASHPHGHAFGFGDRFISGSDGKQLTRWHENAHWQRLSDGHFYGKRVHGPEVGVEHLQAMLNSPNQESAARAAIGLPGLGNSRSWVTMTAVTEDPRERFGYIRDDGRSVVVERAEKALENIICVDGVLHRKGIEPFIRVGLDLSGPEVRVSDIGVETTSGALWSAGTAPYAAFGLGRWHDVMRFVEAHSLPGVKLPGIDCEPRVHLDESVAYDWDVSYKAAKEVQSLRSALSMFSRNGSDILEQVIVSQNADEQYELLLSVDMDDPSWRDNRLARRCYDKAIEILEGRRIKMTPVGGMRP